MHKIKKFFNLAFNKNFLLEPNESRLIVYNTLLILFYGAIELLGLGALILFFINLISNKALVKLNEILINFFGFEIINLNILFYFLLIVVIFKYLLQFLILNITYKNIQKIKNAVTIKLLKKYLNSKSEFLLSKNTSSLVRSVVSDTTVIFVDFFRPVMEIIKELSVLIYLTVFLIYLNGYEIFIFLVLLMLLTLILSKIITKKAKKVSEITFFYKKKFFKNLSEYFLILKEMRSRNIEDYFIDGRKTEYNFITDGFVKENIIQHGLKLSFEIILILGLIFLSSYLVLISKLESTMLYQTLIMIFLPILRIMPSLVRINNMNNKINFNFHLIDDIEKQIRTLNKNQIERNEEYKYDFKKIISFENICFSYGDKKIFERANFKIFKGKKHAFVGPSGQGKSTLMEILVGFKKLQYGEAFIDESPIKELDSYEWRKNFSYVPQDTYLVDEDIVENVTFKKNSVDQQLFNKAIKISELDEFIQNLEDGIKTKVGSLGKRISGGQKQRVSLARAIYNNTEILILDEPTSSLNKDLAFKILEKLSALNKTLIIITHDNELIKNFDYIYEIKDRKINIRK